MTGPRFAYRRVTLGAIFALASCGPGEDALSTDGESPDDTVMMSIDRLTGVEWRMVSLQTEDGVRITPEADAIPTITFVDEAGPAGQRRFGGSGGCNRFNGEYEAEDDGRISVSQGLAMTMMACPEAVMELERSFMTALEGASLYEIDNEGLSITFGGGTIRFSDTP